MNRAVLAFVIAWAPMPACGGAASPRASSQAAMEPAPMEVQWHDELLSLPRIDLSAEQSAAPDTSMETIVVAERHALLGCFGETYGEVVVSLELDVAGHVIGGSTQPGGGQEGLAAVADCVFALARGWRFPASSEPGTRRLVVPLVTRASDGL